MLKLKLNKTALVFLNGSAKLAWFQGDGNFCVQGIPKMGKYVALLSGIDYYLTDSKIKFLKREIDEYNSNRGPSIG